MGTMERVAGSMRLSSIGESGSKDDGPKQMGPCFGGTRGWLATFPPKLGSS